MDREIIKNTVLYLYDKKILMSPEFQYFMNDRGLSEFFTRNYIENNYFEYNSHCITELGLNSIYAGLTATMLQTKYEGAIAELDEEDIEKIRNLYEDEEMISYGEETVKKYGYGPYNTVELKTEAFEEIAKQAREYYVNQNIEITEETQVFEFARFMFDIGCTIGMKGNITKAEDYDGEDADEIPEDFEPMDYDEFYDECLRVFHNKAAEAGAIKEGYIYVSGIDAVADKLLQIFLQDPYLQMQFGSSRDSYYYIIFALAMDAGLVCGKKWSEDIDSIADFVNDVMVQGPSHKADEIRKEYFDESISANQGNDFIKLIFNEYKKTVNPYYMLEDARQYVYRALMAGFMLGVSMITEIIKN